VVLANNSPTNKSGGALISPNRLLAGMMVKSFFDFIVMTEVTEGLGAAASPRIKVAHLRNLHSFKQFFMD